jgi:hypothetical protein
VPRAWRTARLLACWALRSSPLPRELWPHIVADAAPRALIVDMCVQRFLQQCAAGEL